MSSLVLEVAVHRLIIDPDLKLVKQMQRRFRLELQDQITAKVDKLIKAGFSMEVRYPTWLVNIVPIQKKNGQIRVCIDFRDLNKASPKFDFLVYFTKMMINFMIKHEALSFMDGSLGYNQI